MTISLKHAYVNPVVDEGNPNETGPDEWNAEHVLSLATDRLLGRDTAGTGAAEEITVGGGLEFTGSGGIQSSAFTGDVTKAAGGTAQTLATVNSNVGTFGSATQAPQITVNGKGLLTAASNVTVTPAVGSITGLGTGVATFLATPSSANLLAAVTDETGSGKLVFDTSPTFTTNITVPKIDGGAAAGSSLTLESTSGAGTTDFIAFNTASQTERMRLLTTGQLNLATSSSASLSWLVVNNNASAAAAVTPGGPVQLLLAGADGTTTALQMYSYANAGIYQFFRAAGTGASPTGLQADQNIGGFGFAGYTSAGAWTLNKARILGFSSEIWSSTAQGTYFTFETTASGGTTRSEKIRVNASGGLGVGTTSDPGLGLIYTNSADFLMRTKTSLTGGGTANVPTLTAGPVTGNPTKWLPYDDNGTTRYVPAW